MSVGQIEALDRTSGGATGERVYQVLHEAIVSAKLAPGLKLSENELAGELGVSRTPVREALARLREDRLVAIVPQLGTFVTLISPAAVGDAEFVREALECAAVGRAVSRIGHRELEKLQRNLSEQEQARAARDERAFDRLDEDLHRRLCECSGHPIAWTLSRRANGHLDRIRRLSLPDPDYISEMISEHSDIVAAIAAADPAAAEAAMRQHLRMVASGLPRLQKLHPSYFEES